MVRLVSSIPAFVARCVPTQTQHATSVRASATSCATSTQQPATPCSEKSPRQRNGLRNNHATRTQQEGQARVAIVAPDTALDDTEADLVKFDRLIVEHAELALPNPENSNLKRDPTC